MTAPGPIGTSPLFRNVGRFGTLTLAPTRGASADAGAVGSAVSAADAARAQYRTAVAAFLDALGGLANRPQPVYTRFVHLSAPTPATATGRAARVDDLPTPFSRLQTTRPINVETTTVRSSTSPLGLDLSSSASTLSSSRVLGLDVTSPQSASVLASSSALGLDVTTPQADSTIQSTAEMNTATTSLGAYDVALSGSTSHAQFSGAYTGSATSLTVKFVLPVTISSTGSSVSFSVVDQNNNQVGSYSGNLKANQAVAIGSTGLTVRFTAGSVGFLASGTTTVSQTPTTVNTSAAFNAGWGTAPVFENYQQVTAGSFTVNGVSIAVNANDSINSVLARINASSAGVTATTSGDKITLTTNTYSSDPIVLANDTSGFLAATKLSGATTTLGHVRDDLQVLSKTTEFGAVTSGSFTVNGVSIAVNAATDSLSSIMARIDASGAGVTAAYDTTRQAVVLTTTAYSEDLITVGNDTTGFLAAAKLATANTVRGNIRDDQQVLSKTTQFAGVASGSFTVNGASIAVDATSDTLTTLMAKIDAANVGVTAQYDATTDRVVLTDTTNGPNAITVANDSSGFLSAAALDSANTVLGHLPDDSQVLSKTVRFGGVTSGSFTVNGATIAVDAQNDSLDSLIGKINAAGAGVTASYNSTSDTVTFTPSVAGAPLSIENDTTGFLAAANITQGTVGTHVNANGAFNDTTVNGPLFDPGLSVHAGSFTVNGVAIGVSATDTINTVLAKINASSAGVAASYDDASQTITLSATDAAALQAPIVVGNDSSGFLAAVKLDGTADSATGITARSAFDTTLGQMSEYAAVHAGTLTANGHAIAIDPASETLNDVVAALNSTGDVSAILDQSTGQLSVSSRAADPTLTLADTSGVLAALGITGGVFYATPGTPGTIINQSGIGAASNAGTVAGQIEAATTQMNDALSTLATLGSSGATPAGAQSDVQNALDLLSAAGVDGLALADQGGLRVTDRDALATSLAQSADALSSVFEGSDGLRTAVEGLLDAAVQPPPASPSPAPPPPFAVTQVQLGDQIKARFLTSQFVQDLELANQLMPVKPKRHPMGALMHSYGSTSSPVATLDVKSTR